MGCYNSAVVNASIDRVWEVLRDFHDLSWAAGVIESADKVGDLPADRIGARRILNGAFHETLLAINDVDRCLKYSIDDGPGPVSRAKVRGYVGAIRLFPVTDTDATFVEWSSSWESGGDDVAEFCNPIYRALLEALQKHFA